MLDLCKSCPHAAISRWGEGPFAGETCLHVLAANKREKAFIEVLKLTRQAVAEGRLSNSLREVFLRSQATGAIACS